ARPAVDAHEQDVNALLVSIAEDRERRWRWLARRQRGDGRHTVLCQRRQSSCGCGLRCLLQRGKGLLRGGNDRFDGQKGKERHGNAAQHKGDRQRQAEPARNKSSSTSCWCQATFSLTEKSRTLYRAARRPT